jgi:hypothetical protein
LKWHVQQGDKADSKENQTTEVGQTSVSKNAAATVTLSVATWIRVVEKVVRLWVVWGEVGSPRLGIRRQRKLLNENEGLGREGYFNRLPREIGTRLVRD